jgi:hypothetical protein
MSDIPEWAVKRATDLTREAMRDGSWLPIGGHASAAFARYIAEHEEPPVDTLLIEARKLFAEDHRNGLIALEHPLGSCILMSGAGEGLILEGKYDHRREVSQYLAALKRGRELAREEKP